jgi:hypothetical protein
MCLSVRGLVVKENVMLFVADVLSRTEVEFLVVGWW